MARRDWIGLAVAAGVLALVLLFRHLVVEPREWGALCAAAEAPLACRPRAALVWFQIRQLWGAGALLLGLWAFLGGPFWVRVAAVTLGAVATANYNATWGMLGLLLGAWAWIGAAGPRRGAPPVAGSLPERQRGTRDA